MNISPHLLIDAGILSTALTITMVLRAKGNAARREEKINGQIFHSRNFSNYSKRVLFFYHLIKNLPFKDTEEIKSSHKRSF